MERFYKRIGYRGKIDDISLAVCGDFNLGDFVSSKLVLVGYEDFNFIIETIEGRYFVKIFANFRKDDDCRRYVDVMLKAIEKKVSFPVLFESGQGHLHTTKVNGAGLRLCVMEYIDGESYFSLRQKPDSDKVRYLAQQAALINSMNMKPEFVYDSWAIVNFLREFGEKGGYLLPEDLKVIKPLVKQFRDMKVKKLPHCFVHGDIIATNVMKDRGNKDWIIDFAVSNYYPRVQEIAVLACNMLFDENDISKSEKNLRIALEEYQKTIPLTPRELEVLPTYAKLAHAMHVLRANYEKVVEKDTSEENEYWLNEGRKGLQQSA